MTKGDYYEILGIDKNASKEDIKKSYKKLAKKYHPDISKEEESAEKFKEISEAYAVLSDDTKKSQYDQVGHNGFDQKYSQEDIFRNFDFGNVFKEFGFGNSDNIFDMFFGRGRKNRENAIDLRYDLEISFEDAAFGVKKEIEFPRTEICNTCKGTGAYNNKFETCQTCKGNGQVRRVIRSPFGNLAQVTICPECRGQGRRIKEPCKTCQGQGILEKTRTLKIDIPPGVGTGTQIRLDSEGGANKSGEHGDLFVVIHVLPHKLFEREGYDIYLEIPVSFKTLALGDKIEVPTLKGKAKLKIPPGTESHTTFRLKGEGIKKLQGYGKGDQYLKIIVDIPKKLSLKQKRLLKGF